MEEQLNKPTIMSTSLKWGLISGIVSIAMSLIRTLAFGSNPMDSDWKMSLLSIAIGIVLIVLAHREFKNEGDGFMSYGQGFKIGFLVSLFSFIIGSIFLFVYITIVDPSLYAEIWDKAAEQMREQGQNEEAIEMGMKIGRIMMWVFIAVMGLVISAILGALVPLFTKKDNPQPGF